MDELKLWGMEPKLFLMLMHLSQLSSIFIPLSGLVLPIVMWATTKQQSPDADRHGKAIINWILSFLIYYVSFIILIAVIGFLEVFPTSALLSILLFLTVSLGLLNFIFIIIGSIKANNGNYWPYPSSMSFFQ